MLMFSHLKLNIRNPSFICKFLKPSLRCSAGLPSCLAAWLLGLHLPSAGNLVSLTAHLATQQLTHLTAGLPQHAGLTAMAWAHADTSQVRQVYPWHRGCGGV